jgi:hypothetical protein
MCTQADFIENENGDNGVLNDGGLAPYFVMSKLQPIVIVNLKKNVLKKNLSSEENASFKGISGMLLNIAIK